MINFSILCFKSCNPFVPDFENLRHLVHLNDNLNGTLVDGNSDEEIVLDIITDCHDK